MPGEIAIEPLGTRGTDLCTSIYNNAMGKYKTDRQLRFIRNALPNERSEIMDIGGGTGRLAMPLASLGHRVTVVDPSDVAISLLRTRSNGAVEGITSDLASLRPNPRFEAVLLIDTLKYVSGMELKEVFQRVASQVKAGGHVVVSEINRGSWRNKLSEISGRRDGVSYNIASCAEYLSALRSSGLQPTAASGYL